MELMDYLQDAEWTRVPGMNSKDHPTGYEKYHIMSHTVKEPGLWEYLVANCHTGASKLVMLKGGLHDKDPKHDPLKGIGNIGLKLGGEEGHQIIGILAYDDCVEFTFDKEHQGKGN